MGVLTQAPPLLVFLVGVLTIVCTVEMLGAAVLRRLVLGDVDACTLEVQIPKISIMRGWAVRQDPAANLPVLFVALTALTIVGFGAFFASLEYIAPGSFEIPSEASRLTALLYFSIVLFSTIGFGDVFTRYPLRRKSRHRSR